MAKMDETRLRGFALAGAEKRLAELRDEAAAIFRMFPQLRARGRRAAAEPDTSTNGTPKARRRRRLSAAGRKRISDAQKARWAKHRGEAAAAPARKAKAAR